MDLFAEPGGLGAFREVYPLTILMRLFCFTAEIFGIALLACTYLGRAVTLVAVPLSVPLLLGLQADPTWGRYIALPQGYGATMVDYAIAAVMGTWGLFAFAVHSGRSTFLGAWE